MQTDLQVIGPEAAVNEAAIALAEAHVSGLPVVDRRRHLVGVISSTDILASEEEVEGEAGRVALFEETLVRDLMTPRPVTVTPTATVKEAAQLLLYADVHRVFVLDGDRLVGVLSTTDIVRAVATGQL
jgi:CIC family chloride channel protein